MSGNLRECGHYVTCIGGSNGFGILYDDDEIHIERFDRLMIQAQTPFTILIFKKIYQSPNKIQKRRNPGISPKRGMVSVQLKFRKTEYVPKYIDAECSEIKF